MPFCRFRNGTRCPRNGKPSAKTPSKGSSSPYCACRIARREKQDVRMSSSRSIAAHPTTRKPAPPLGVQEDMDEAIRQALELDRTIDITTTGRKSGRPQRIEIWFHNLDGRLYITGTPGRRNWYANLSANPDFTFHLKVSAQADLAARARLIEEA